MDLTMHSTVPAQVTDLFYREAADLYMNLLKLHSI